MDRLGGAIRPGNKDLFMNPFWWALLGAFFMGLAKGGLSGLGNLTVVIFAMAFEPRASVGILLPVLIAADVVAVAVYRRHTQWVYLRRLLPWMAVGLLIGWQTLDLLDGRAMQQLIGGILLTMTALHFWRSWQLRSSSGNAALEQVPHSLWFRLSTGLLGGFATMAANAAGPVATLYFLAVGLPKLEFIGTGAWAFFILNLVKVPFSIDLGLITWTSLQTSLQLMPAAVVGAMIAPKIVHHIPQKLFAAITWVFVILGAVKLLWS